MTTIIGICVLLTLLSAAPLLWSGDAGDRILAVISVGIVWAIGISVSNAGLVENLFVY